MRLLSMAAAILALAMFLYATTSFMKAEVDPFQWGREDRSAMVLALFFLSPFAAMFGAWAYEYVSND